VARSAENTGFVCAQCGESVLPLTNGSYRNHCPSCLHSLHVDDAPGDRASDCGGVMEPIGLRRGKKHVQVVHRCLRCGAVRPNRVAERTLQPDRFDALVLLSSRG
jgi:DNA-directed RNA polymerase subunit RPC12/RpoP